MATAPGETELVLPQALELHQYRLFNPDLRAFSDEVLAHHYHEYGLSEGRQANSLHSRDDFVALIPAGADSLEIGPFHNPLLRSERTKYFDVMPQAGLASRAEALGISQSHIPYIDYVSCTGDLTVVDRTFDYVLSSHSIEHQPDLITHLNDVANVLRARGRYFVLVPDKRYCFDHYIAETTLADVIEAYQERRKGHTLRSVLQHRALTTHNDHARHWRGDHGVFMDNYEPRIKAALEEHARAQKSYIDVHAWFFTPASAALLLSALRRLRYTNFELERLYPTHFGANEFWLVLQKFEPP